MLELEGGITGGFCLLYDEDWFGNGAASRLGGNGRILLLSGSYMFCASLLSQSLGLVAVYDCGGATGGGGAP